MLQFIDTEAIFEKLKVWHLVLSAVIIFVLITTFSLGILFGAPRYFTYLEEVKMHRAIEWAETNVKIGMIVGPSLEEHPTLNYYLKNNSK